MAVLRMLSPYVAGLIVANPLQVKAIGHAHVKTDKMDARLLAPLRAADSCPKSGCRIGIPSDCADWRQDVVRFAGHRTRIKNEVDAICALTWSRPAQMPMPTCSCDWAACD